MAKRPEPVVEVLVSQARRAASKLDVLLAFPPFCAVTLRTVYPAPFFLANYLSQHGMRSDVWDLNRDCLAMLLHPRYVNAALAKRRALRRGLESATALSRRRSQRYYATIQDEWRLTLIQQNLPDLVREANLKALHIGDASYSFLLQPLVDDFVVVSAELPSSAQALSEVLLSPAVRRFRGLVRPYVRQRLARHEPRVIGLSVPFVPQFAAALAIARECRRSAPQAAICLGGPVATLMLDDLKRDLLRSRVIDYIITEEGENPLLELAKAVRRHRVPAPNSQTLSRRADGSVSLGASTVAMAPVRGSRHLRVGLQGRTGDGIFIPVLQSRGCYWGKCHFCDFVHLYCRTRYDAYSGDVDQSFRPEADQSFRSKPITSERPRVEPLESLLG